MVSILPVDLDNFCERLKLLFVRVIIVLDRINSGLLMQQR